MASLTHYWVVSATADHNAEPLYAFELCIPDNGRAQPVVSGAVTSPGAPGYWRLWRPVSDRIKAECRFGAPGDLVPRSVRYASFDERAGAYGDWQEHQTR